MFKVKFADIGEGLTEGKVLEIQVKLGDTVKAGQSLFYVETDKVNSEIPSPVDGKIAVIHISEGQDINVGDIVIEIDDGNGASTEAPKIEVKQSQSEPEEDNASVVGSTPVSNKVIASRVPNTNVDFINNKTIKAAPFTRKAADDKGIELSSISPSGKDGQILMVDLTNISPQVQAVQTNQTQVIQPNTNASGFVSPLARKVAADKGIDLSLVSLSANNGRIVVADLVNVSSRAAQQSVTPAQVSTPTQLKVDRDEPLSWTSHAMNGVRKATVKAMTHSMEENAPFTGMKNMDISETYKMRASLKSHAEKSNIKLTFLAFIVKAAAKALEDMPNINSRIDKNNNAILFINNINIAIAVDTPDGLMVPVIKGANHLSIFEIANAISDLANKAKNRKLSMSEMKDATFTVSNFGIVGLDYATPIINSPESAIMGIGSMKKTPIFVGDDVRAAWMMPFSMTCDHRIIDGADAGRFLNKVEEYLQNPALLLID